MVFERHIEFQREAWPGVYQNRNQEGMRADPDPSYCFGRFGGFASFGRFVLVVLMVPLVPIVSFRSFRFAVSGFSTSALLSSVLKFPNVLDLQSQESTYNAWELSAIQKLEVTLTYPSGIADNISSEGDSWEVKKTLNWSGLDNRKPIALFNSSCSFSFTRNKHFLLKIIVCLKPPLVAIIPSPNTPYRSKWFLLASRADVVPMRCGTLNGGMGANKLSSEPWGEERKTFSSP